MAQKNRNAETTDVKNLLLETPDLIREIVTQTVQQILESEMDEALGARRSERTEERAGHRSGYYDRSFITRVGKFGAADSSGSEVTVSNGAVRTVPAE